MVTPLLLLTCAQVFANDIAQPASTPLTLDAALKLAKDRNGTIRAAQFEVEAADSRLKQSFAPFLPTITPSYQYISNRQQVSSAAGGGFVQSEGATTAINATWRLLDAGQRSFSYASSSNSLKSQRFNSRQTLRTVLFTVVQQYYETLRAQELLKVSQSQVERASTILDQTTTRVKVGNATPIERLQANADFQNARVQVLIDKNWVSTNAASLKATLGIDSDSPLPELTTTAAPTSFVSLEPLVQVEKRGLLDRPDLLALYRAVDAARYSYLRADREANLSYTVDVSYIQQFGPENLQNRTADLLVTYPLFDGNERREVARELRSTLAAQNASLLQAIRSARAEIESAYASVVQDRERLDAAKAANDAARENYTQAQESQRLGAYDLIQVLTANVSLVTAESNYIQAIYDYAISDTRLKLVTGQPIPGE